MPHYWVQRVQDELNEAAKAVKGSRVLVLGVAYKRDVSDIRESLVLDIIRLLEEKGAVVFYHDPHAPSFHHEGVEMASTPALDATLEEADCVVIATDHSAYDWGEMGRMASMVVDTRGGWHNLCLFANQ